MSARCGERNSSLTRTRASAGGRVAGVPPALPQRTRESRVPSGSRARMPASSELAGANRQLAFWSSPARRSAVEPSAFLPNTGVVLTRARMGLRPLEIERFQILVRKVCKNEEKFLEKFVIFRKNRQKLPKFLRNLGYGRLGPGCATSRKIFL